MSAWTTALSPAAFLAGAEGKLIQIQVSTEPKLLEKLLDCLADLSFPINPQIYHGLPSVVEFPAYEGRLDEVRKALQLAGFDENQIRVSGMLQAISAA